MSQIIATDLDGTLLGSDTEISRENLDALERLYRRGIRFVALTGRTFFEIPGPLRESLYFDYFVYSNGAVIRSREQGELYANPIDLATAKSLYDMLLRHETLIELYCDNHPVLEKRFYNDDAFAYYAIDADFLPEMTKSRRTVDDLTTLLTDGHHIEMFDVFFHSLKERDEAKNRIKTQFPALELTTSLTHNWEIMNKGVNKGSGLLKLCELAGLKLSDIIVIGDSRNDLTSFAVAENRYAVANACDELKAIADKIICSNDEHILCYLERIL